MRVRGRAFCERWSAARSTVTAPAPPWPFLHQRLPLQAPPHLVGHFCVICFKVSTCLPCSRFPEEESGQGRVTREAPPSDSAHASQSTAAGSSPSPDPNGAGHHGVAGAGDAAPLCQPRRAQAREHADCRCHTGRGLGVPPRGAETRGVAVPQESTPPAPQAKMDRHRAIASTGGARHKPSQISQPCACLGIFVFSAHKPPGVTDPSVSQRAYISSSPGPQPREGEEPGALGRCVQWG